MNDQAVSPTVLNTYRVDAALRFEGSEAPQQVSFLVEAESGKAAWVEARRITRIGAKVKSPTQEIVQLAAGLYTVRNVSSIERRDRKPRIVTLDTFLEAAKAANLTLPKKLLELISTLQQPQQPVAPQQPKPSAAEEQSTAA